MSWDFTYRPEAIPLPGPSAVINNHRPGLLIGRAITEIQGRAVNSVEVTGDGVEIQAEIVDNVLKITVKVVSPSEGDGDQPFEPYGGLPSGGVAGQVLTSDGAGGALWDWLRAVEV